MALSPRRGGFSSQFRANTVAAKLTVATIVGSLLYTLFKHSFGTYLPLIPADVLHGFVWQPLTYGFVGGDPMSVMFGALAIWSLGGSLEMTWGPRRLLAFALTTTAAAGALAVLLSLLLPSLRAVPFFGIWVLGTNLWVAYGLSHGRGQTNFIKFYSLFHLRINSAG